MKAVGQLWGNDYEIDDLPLFVEQLRSLGFVIILLEIINRACNAGKSIIWKM